MSEKGIEKSAVITSAIYTLIPVDTPEEFIPPSLCGTPSPPYIQDRDEDPVHDGVLEYWADPGV